jgi:hypothetical protein
MSAGADVDRQRSPRAIDLPLGTFLHRALLLLLAIVPFWYGGVGHVPLALAATVVVILAVALTIATMTRDADFPIPLRVIALPALGLSAVVAWAVVQALAPARIAANPAWRLAADTLRIDIVGRVSVAPGKDVAPDCAASLARQIVAKCEIDGLIDPPRRHRLPRLYRG